mmetsp:Transcript_20573/g.61351  ORF Transcript_20573/g.61351 Transcript_20573/m.61351 type:complete len:107 (-) Transcript_20573:1485-1805(-)
MGHHDLSTANFAPCLINIFYHDLQLSELMSKETVTGIIIMNESFIIRIYLNLSVLQERNVSILTATRLQQKSWSAKWVFSCELYNDRNFVFPFCLYHKIVVGTVYM